MIADRPRYVALAWKHPENIVEELSPHEKKWAAPEDSQPFIVEVLQRCAKSVVSFTLQIPYHGLIRRHMALKHVLMTFDQWSDDRIRMWAKVYWPTCMLEQGIGGGVPTSQSQTTLLSIQAISFPEFSTPKIHQPQFFSPRFRILHHFKQSWLEKPRNPRASAQNTPYWARISPKPKPDSCGCPATPHTLSYIPNPLYEKYNLHITSMIMRTSISHWQPLEVSLHNQTIVKLEWEVAAW